MRHFLPGLFNIFVLRRSADLGELFRLVLNFDFQLATSVGAPEDVNLLEFLLRYRSSSDTERWQTSSGTGNSVRSPAVQNTVRALAVQNTVIAPEIQKLI